MQFFFSSVFARTREAAVVGQRWKVRVGSTSREQRARRTREFEVAKGGMEPSMEHRRRDRLALGLSVLDTRIFSIQLYMSTEFLIRPYALI